jgi:hypothetical protein
MTPGEYRIEVEIPPGRRRRRAQVVARDLTGRIITTCCADLMDAAGRRRAARDLCRRLGGGAAELERLLEQRWAEALTAAEQAPPEQPEAPAGPRYHDADGYLVLVKSTRDGDVAVPLATWTARIVEQTVIDDGAERRTVLAVEGRLADGTLLPRAEVPAREYPGMRWPVEVWGTKAVVLAGLGTADHLRCAVQILSGDPPTRVVFGHTGWREVDGAWCYLHAAGALGTDGRVAGVEVQLPEALAGYSLPDPPAGDELAGAVRASLAVLELAPDRITVPLLGAVYRAVLGTADYSLHLAGPTGVGKTELAGLAQMHHGPGLGARNLPGSWASTGNSLESAAFSAKDALFTVDDFAPTGSIADVARAHREADRLLRAQGNRAGRARCRTDGTVRAGRSPRGTVLSTGEDLPRGQSLRARLLVLELAPGELNWGRLTDCQRDGAAGRFAQALAGYVSWLAPRYTDVRDGLRAETAGYRDRVHAEGLHARTPGTLGDLAAGWSWWLDYALAVGAIDAGGREALARRAWTALLAAGAEQAAHVEAAEPCGHYLRLLVGALASGRAHVAGLDGDKPADDPTAWGWRATEILARDGPDTRWDAMGRRIGWLDNDDLLLQPDAAYATAQQLAHEQGDSLAVTEPTLRRRLHELGLLQTIGSRSGRVRLTVRRVVEGARREVLHLRAASLSDARESAPCAPSAPSATRARENGAQPWGTQPPGHGSVPHEVPHAAAENAGNGAQGAQGALLPTREGAAGAKISPPPGAQLYYEGRDGRPCGRAEAVRWCWEGGPAWYDADRHPPPPPERASEG